MKHAIKIVLVSAVVACLGASCGGAGQTNANAASNINTATQQDIIYGTNMEPAFVEQSRQDCQQRGGTFDQCGSACNEGEMCIAACALRCDF